MTQLDDFFAHILGTDREMAALKPLRADLLDALRALDAQSVDIHYDGYDDSGSVTSVRVWPADIAVTDDLQHRLESFGFRFAYVLNPGFEIDDGASGILIWDLTTDSINMEHRECYREYVTTMKEGL